MFLALLRKLVPWCNLTELRRPNLGGSTPLHSVFWSPRCHSVERPLPTNANFVKCNPLVHEVLAAVTVPVHHLKQVLGSTAEVQVNFISHSNGKGITSIEHDSNDESLFGVHANRALIQLLSFLILTVAFYLHLSRTTISVNKR